jgi:hypothetical protein
MKTLIATVEFDGSYVIEAEGYNGVGCKDAISRLTRGATPISGDDKPEMLQVEQEQERQSQ